MDGIAIGEPPELGNKQQMLNTNYYFLAQIILLH
jgi:hypothetical protein